MKPDYGCGCTPNVRSLVLPDVLRPDSNEKNVTTRRCFPINAVRHRESADNVAVVKKKPFGSGVTCPMIRRSASGTVPPGHRFATRDISSRANLRQHGQPIRSSLASERRPFRTTTYRTMFRWCAIRGTTPYASSVYMPEDERATFMGFRRPDGRGNNATSS
jgi:altronate hydrolase